MVYTLKWWPGSCQSRRVCHACTELHTQLIWVEDAHEDAHSDAGADEHMDTYVLVKLLCVSHAVFWCTTISNREHSGFSIEQIANNSQQSSARQLPDITGYRKQVYNFLCPSNVSEIPTSHYQQPSCILLIFWDTKFDLTKIGHARWSQIRVHMTRFL